MPSPRDSFAGALASRVAVAFKVMVEVEPAMLGEAERALTRLADGLDAHARGRAESLAAAAAKRGKKATAGRYWEDEIQAALFVVLDLLVQQNALVAAWAVPNGGRRDPATAGRLKATGVKPGVPDIHIKARYLGSSVPFAFDVEMKSPDLSLIHI